MAKEIKEIVIDSLKEFNEEMDYDKKIEISEESVLLGPKSILDSLGIVTLTIIIEKNIFEKLNKSITILNKNAFSKKYSPFKNVENLIKYVTELEDNKK